MEWCETGAAASVSRRKAVNLRPTSEPQESNLRPVSLTELQEFEGGWIFAALVIAIQAAVVIVALMAKK
jgi:hypothetical protein